MKRVKINLKYNLLFLSPLIFFSGCVYDELREAADEGFHFSDLTQVGYMPFILNLENEVPSRSNDQEFDYGDINEVALAPGGFHFAVFYTDSSNKPAYIASLEGALSNDEEKKHKENFSFSYARLLGAELLDNETLLKSLSTCIVILNSPLSGSEIYEMDKKDLFNIIIKDPTIKGRDGKKYLTMINSSYLDENGKIIRESKVDPTKIYDSKITALEKAFNGEAAVNTYVERIAAKFSLHFDETKLDKVDPNEDEFIFKPQGEAISVFKEINETTGIPTYDNTYSYQVKITGWGMNAQEKENYLIKNISSSTNYFTGWNDIKNIRSYWSEDPDYNDIIYPLQYRRAVDKQQYYYETLESQNKNLLQNYSYEQIVGQNNFGKKIYTLENTYDYSSENLNNLLGDRIDLLAGTHLLITAELLTNIDEKFKYAPRDVYRDRSGNFYRNQKDCFIAMVTEFNHSLKSHDRMDFKPYIWDESDTYTDLNTLKMSTQGEYQLCHNGNIMTYDYMNKLNLDSYIIPANVDGGDGKCIIWIDGLSIQKIVNGQPSNTKIQVIERITIDNEYGNEIHKLREDPVSENELKSFLYDWMGALEHFKDGKMYYAIPVLHYSQNQKNIYGVVRNHSYTFSIEGIKQVGVSVDDPTQPIIPREVINNKRVEIKTEILDWHNFETSFTPNGFNN